MYVWRRLLLSARTMLTDGSNVRSLIHWQLLAERDQIFINLSPLE